MSVEKVDVTLINKIVRTVAKQGGDLNKIDTDEERSLFADQLEKMVINLKTLTVQLLI